MNSENKPTTQKDIDDFVDSILNNIHVVPKDVRWKCVSANMHRNYIRASFRVADGVVETAFDTGAEGFVERYIVWYSRTQIEHRYGT